MMGALSKILRNADDGMLLFKCPGCHSTHGIKVGEGSGPRWTWNGNAEAPTFTPSILVQGVEQLTDEQYAAYLRGEPLPEPTPLVCHSFVTDGRIQFLGDCTHELANQTVAIPEWGGA